MDKISDEELLKMLDERVAVRHTDPPVVPAVLAAARIRELLEVLALKNWSENDFGRWLHVGRGTTYSHVATAYLQSSGGPVPENTELMIYTAQGRMWARPAPEFLDGRFKRVK